MTTAYSSENWFSAIYTEVAHLPLSNLTFPGSHDSGMSELHGISSNISILGPWTQTQSLTVGEQILKGGARYLDLRPVYYKASIASDVPSGLYTAHYSVWGSLNSWTGLIGRSWSDVCADLKAAIATLGSNEIVLIELSHAAHLLEGGSKTGISSDDQADIVNDLIAALGSNIFMAPTSTKVFDLSPADIFDGKAGPKFIIWCSDGSLDDCDLNSTKGYFSSAQLAYVNSWNDADYRDPDDVISGLTNALVKYAHTKLPKGVFLMAWHCTWHLTGPGDSLKDLASELNAQFSAQIADWLGSKTIELGAAFPTIIAWDYVTAWADDMVPTCISLCLGAAAPEFVAVLASNSGIGGYDMKSTYDLGMAFDYDSSGMNDHLIFYRPGSGTIFILQNNSGAFSPIFTQTEIGGLVSGQPGIGGFDLMSKRDLGFAFDYDGSGKLDHLVFYRPGSGTIFIIKNDGGTFSPTFTSSSGIGGFDLKSTADRVFAYDYDGSGLLDHLVLYRPGSGTIFILKNQAGVFSAVYTGGGIGGFDLGAQADQGIAIDYDGSGKADHLLFYRPGAQTIYIIKNISGAFTPVYATTTQGIGGYDLKSPSDRIIGFDYGGTGISNYLAPYRPGGGAFFIIANDDGNFSPVYTSQHGIGTFDFQSQADKAFAFDYDGVGLMDHLVLCRPGGGVVYIVARNLVDAAGEGTVHRAVSA